MVNVYCFSVVPLLLPSSERSSSVTSPGAWDWGSRLRACLFLRSFLRYVVFRQTFAHGWLKVSLSRRDLSQLSQALSRSEVCRYPVVLPASLLEKQLQMGKLSPQGVWSNFLLSPQWRISWAHVLSKQALLITSAKKGYICLYLWFEPMDLQGACRVFVWI